MELLINSKLLETLESRGRKSASAAGLGPPNSGGLRVQSVG